MTEPQTCGPGRETDEKRALRREYCARRASLTPEAREAADALIFRRVAGWRVYLDAPLLLTYVSFGDETDTRRLIADALGRGKRVAAPVCRPGGRMDFYEFASLEALKPGRYGIPEPEGGARRACSDTAGALCIVPGLCFDAWGGRIGYGSGYYDRFLENFSGVTAGLCRSAALCSRRLPQESRDIRVQYVVTEHGFPCEDTPPRMHFPTK